MQRAVTGTALGQHSRLLSLLQPWASETASLRLFGTSGSKVCCGQCQMQVFPAVYRQAVTVQLHTTPPGHAVLCKYLTMAQGCTMFNIVEVELSGMSC